VYLARIDEIAPERRIGRQALWRPDSQRIRVDPDRAQPMQSEMPADIHRSLHSSGKLPLHGSGQKRPARDFATRHDQHDDQHQPQRPESARACTVASGCFLLRRFHARSRQSLCRAAWRWQQGRDEHAALPHTIRCPCVIAAHCDRNFRHAVPALLAVVRLRDQGHGTVPRCEETSARRVGISMGTFECPCLRTLPARKAAGVRP